MDNNALELYKHEDNLNWTKLNHLIISTAAIATGIGLILEKISEKHCEFYTTTTHLLFILGGCVIISFAISINSGVENMKYWKNKIIETEVGCTKSDDCKCRFKKNKSVLENSSTRGILFVLPYIFLAVWVYAYYTFWNF